LGIRAAVYGRGQKADLIFGTHLQVEGPVIPRGVTGPSAFMNSHKFR